PATARDDSKDDVYGHHGRRHRQRQPVYAVGGDAALDVGQRIRLHRVDPPTRHADPLRGEVPGATLGAPTGHEAEFPADVAQGGRRRGPVELRAAWWLGPQQAAPGQEPVVTERTPGL